METQTAQKAELSFKPEDFASDIAKLAAEQGTPIVPAVEVKAEAKVEPTVTPAQPDTPAAVTPEPTATQAPAPVPQVAAVPEKFKGPDGQIDAAKLEKSTVNVDQALTSYLAKEKELKRKINDVKAAENAYLNPANAPAPVPSQVPLNVNIPFHQQLEQDVQAIGLGKTLEKLFTASQETALDQARRELTPIKQGFEEATTRQQIEAIGKADPWVYTPEGVAALNQILDSNPYLMQAADPYKAAYVYHRGLNGVSQTANSQVVTPTPTAKASAPVPTAVAANMAPQALTINLDSKEAIDNHLKTLTVKQQDEFFVKMGFPRFDTR